MQKITVVAGAALISLWLAADTGMAAGIDVTVAGTANPFLAGQAAGSCCFGDSAPGQSPAYAGSVSAGSVITFTNVTGGVSYWGGPITDGPDGASSLLISSPSYEGGFTTINNIAGFYNAPVDSLVGVFLGPGDPNLNPAPTLLDFSSLGTGTDFSTLSPQLQQIFFIGDGLTGTGSGAVQTFIAPDGATRLYLGTVDGFGWYNNSGSISVTVNATSSVVPEPRTLALLFAGLLVIGLWGRYR